MPQTEVIQANVVGCLVLAGACHERWVHLTYYGTGCIFHYDDAHPVDSGVGFRDDDRANFTGSFYAHTKARRCLLCSLVHKECCSFAGTCPVSFG